MAGLDAEEGDFEVAHVGNVGDRTEAIFLTIDEVAGIGFAEELTIGGAGAIEGGGEGGVFLDGAHVFLHGLEGIETGEEEGAGLAGHGVGGEVVSGGLGGAHGLHEGGFGFFVSRAGFAGLGVFANDVEDFGGLVGGVFLSGERGGGSEDQRREQQKHGEFFHGCSLLCYLGRRKNCTPVLSCQLSVPSSQVSGFRVPIYNPVPRMYS